MAEITFINYFISSVDYQENINFNNASKQLMVDIAFKADVKFINNQIWVNLMCSLGEEEKENCPFLMETVVHGLFEYEVDKDNKEDKQQLKSLGTENTIAILYPYLRAFISNIVLNANAFPAYQLPLINVIDMMKKGDSITITGFDED